MNQGAIRMERDPGGWLVRRDAEIAAWAERERLWPGRTVAQFARRLFVDDPARMMIVDEDRSLSCGELYRKACGLAGYMRSLGIDCGDVVSFQLPNWWEATVVNLAAAMIGAVVNPILPINRDAELAFILRDTGAKLIFVPETFRRFDYGAMIERVARHEVLGTKVVHVRGSNGAAPDFAEACDFPSPIDDPMDVDANAVKLIMYTSGTTGRPKGVLHSHNSINADSVKMQAAIALGAGDRSFMPSPVTHVTGYLWVLNVPWACNVPAVTIDQWDPVRAFDLLHRHGCAFMAGATPFLKDLVGVAKGRDIVLSSLRNYLCGGASVPPDLIREASRIFPNCIAWRNYGSTEAPTLTRNPRSREEAHLGAETDGRIYHAEIEIRDPRTGQLMPTGEDGEIFVRSPSMALGYVHAEDNESAYDEYGFFRMGDVGRIVEDDHILITDRLKDIIIRSGENLSSKEIEDALMRSPLIDDAAVVGIPSEKTGESVFAFLVAPPGAQITLALLLRIIDAAGLARQKTPEGFALLDELPRTASGKVLKHELRAKARAIGAASSQPA